MAGALTISTLNNDTGVLATQNGMTGIAKAWVRAGVSGTTPTITGSFNISSITRNSTGVYTFAFTTAMPNANYSIVAMGSTDTSLTYPVWANLNPTGISITSSAFPVYWFVGGVGLLDPLTICVAVLSS
jgi:hypothetical protein